MIFFVILLHLCSCCRQPMTGIVQEGVHFAMFKIQVFENSGQLWLEVTVESDHIPAPGHHINLNGLSEKANYVMEDKVKYAMVTDVCWNLEGDKLVPTVEARLGQFDSELRRQYLWQEGYIGTNVSPH